MSKPSSKLPTGWLEAKLATLSEIIAGQSPPSETYNRDAVGLPFYQGKADFGLLYPTARTWCATPTKIARHGDILISVRAPVGPTNLAAAECGIGRGLAAIRPFQNVHPMYILYALRWMERGIAALGTGTTFSAITGETLRSLSVPIAPSPEQLRIVTKIDELFSRIDAGEQALKKVRALLKNYRQSVLKAAVTGELTKAWREKNAGKGETGHDLLKRILKARREAWEAQELAKLKAKGKTSKDEGWKEKYKEPEPPEMDGLPKLPEEWAWASWEHILAPNEQAFKRGPFGSALRKNIFVSEGFKVYEQYCPINDDCSFERYFITAKKFEELKAFSVLEGDFLISCSGVTLGRITQVPKGARPGIINQALLRVRLNRNIYSDLFFKTYFRGQFFQTRIFENSAGAAIPNVRGVRELKSMPVPLMPIPEQEEIVRVFIEWDEKARILEQEIGAQEKRLSALRQSVLRAAFSGQLVPQDPADEPASVLLERIGVERAADGGPKPIRAPRKSSKLKAAE